MKIIQQDFIYKYRIYLTSPAKEVIPMIVTTTQTVEGRQISEYKGIVFGEVVSGVNFVKDLFSGITDILAGAAALTKMNCRKRAKKLLTKCASVLKD